MQRIARAFSPVLKVGKRRRRPRSGRPRRVPLRGGSHEAFTIFLPVLVSAALLGACTGGAGTSPISGAPESGGALQPQGATASSPAFLTSAADNAALKYKIYVANFFSSTVTTYKSSGTQTTPTISTGVASPTGVAVDASGKIYVANYYASTVTTYKANGKQTTPTITGEVVPISG